MPVSSFTNLSGRPLTKGLFFETTGEDKYGVMYTLKDKDHESKGVIYPSLYRLYIECSDPTEYEFANQHLDGWSHWQMISNSSWFKEHVDRWRWELELKLKAAAIRRIAEEAQGNGRAKFAANKFLVDGGWTSKADSKNPVGRPTQERIKQEAERLNQIEQEILDDHQRLN